MKKLRKQNNDEIKRLLQQAAKISSLKNIYLNYIGEPTLHPRFGKILQLCSQLELNSKVAIITNGTTLKEVYKILIDSNIKRVTVSIDGPKNYNEKWRRGTNHGEIISGLAKLRAYRDLKKSDTIISVLSVRSHQTEIELGQLINDIRSYVDWCCFC